MKPAGAKTIDLALQGGGAHGAFTWGVLHRLLEDERVWFDGVSGTSAGAMNAAVLAEGLRTGGRPAAIAALARFWQRVGAAAAWSPLRRTPIDAWLGRWSLGNSPAYVALDTLSRLVSPYQFNPLNLNPLRELLAELIDFERAKACNTLGLFIAATNVRTGKPRIFRRHELSADVLLASACLPHLFQAVEVQGEHYWDGGYMGNPVLQPLVEESAADDLVIVQITPIVRPALPTSAPAILERLNEITFNASLIHDVRAIRLMQQLVEHEGLDRSRYRAMRLHRIHAEDTLRELGASSKLNAEPEFLDHLHGIGYRAAAQWLEESFVMVGERTTVDVEAVWLWPERPAVDRIVMTPHARLRGKG